LDAAVLRPALPAALIAAALLPAAASAATISTTDTLTKYDGAQADRVSIAVYSGFDDEIGNTAVFFLPTANDIVDPTTSDANCRARPTGASSCLARSRTKIVTAGQDDFFNVGAAGNVVELRMGGGIDRVFTTSARIEAYGEAGNDDLSGYTGFDILDGGADDDLLSPLGAGDQVAGGTGTDTVRYGGYADPVVVTLDGVNDDGKAGESQNVAADVENITGGTGADDLSGSAAANVLRGGEGGDTLQGAGGADQLFGEGGDDTLRSRDGVADAVDCGPGNDTAVVDPLDTVDADCETVQLPDNDGDGVTQPLDCNDANPAIKPGATEIAGDGIDQDCSGADLPKAGGPGPVDPDPADPDPVDPKPADPERVDARMLARWGLGKRATVIFQFDVKDIPAGGKVSMRCKGKGCPFKRRTVEPKGSTAKLGKHFKDARLKPGTTLEVRVTAPGMVGKVVRYTFRSKRRLPSSTRRCLAPGATKPSRC
jgi:hypothetical protein